VKASHCLAPTLSITEKIALAASSAATFSSAHFTTPDFCTESPAAQVYIESETNEGFHDFEIANLGRNMKPRPEWSHHPQARLILRQKGKCLGGLPFLYRTAYGAVSFLGLAVHSCYP